MNTINYAVEFEYAAMALLAMLLALFLARRKYPGASNVIYLGMVACTFMASLTHILAIKTLPVAAELPLWLDYVIHISYFIFYDYVGIVFLLYVAALTHRNSISKRNMILSLSLAAAEFIVLVTTPFTRLVIYFDENMQYQHGSLFFAFFVVAVLIFAYASVMFAGYRRKLSRMQAATIIVFEALTLGATLLQIFVPRLVVANFASSLALVMILIVLQNPDDFTDKGAGCYNYDAFFISVGTKIEQKKPFTIVAFRFNGLNYISGLFEVSDRDCVAKAISSRLKAEFRTNEIYHLGNCEFAMFTNERRRITEQYLTDRLLRRFSAG